MERNADGSVNQVLEEAFTAKGGYTYDIAYYVTIFDSLPKKAYAPMVNEGTTAHPYEPYFEGIRSTKVEELFSEGENLILFPYSAGFDKTRNGIRYVVSDNGTVTATGTAEKASPFELCSIILPKGTYHVSGCPENTPSGIQLYVTNSNYSIYKYDTGNGASFTISTEERFSVAINIPVGVTVDGLKFKPMLVRGSAARPYKRYFSDKLTVPEYIRAVPDYGEGIGVYGYSGSWVERYNHVDFARGVYARECRRKVFDGSEAFLVQSVNGNGVTNFLWQSPTLEAARGVNNAVGAPYEADNNEIAKATRDGFYIFSTAFYFRSTKYKTVEEWKTHLAELYASGNPLTLVYALEIPEETDVSEYLTDEFMEVEAGGTITLVNEHGQAAPCEITYLINTTGG